MRTNALLSVAGALLTLSLAAGCRSTAAGSPIDDIAAARGVDIVYAGESHDEMAHHVHQLELLRAVTESAKAGGVPALFGLEMFERPAQKHLDDYVAGRIDELEMLRRTEYFTRWRANHLRYAPLWQYCRENGVRVVALNADKTITNKITSDGLASLSSEQRAEIAEEIDFTVEAHRERLIAVLSKVHPMEPEPLERYYQSQTTWDETMAESAVDALREAGPGARMLVIAGNMHIQQYTSIPDRVTRRLPDTTRLVVVMRTEGRPHNDEGLTDSDLGDVVVRLPAIPEPKPARMGIYLQDAPLPEGILITSVVPFSNAARAGILADDIVQFIGSAPVTDMADLRYALDRIAVGTTLPVRVLRVGHKVTVIVTFAVPPMAAKE